MTEIWNLALFEPMLNSLVLLYGLLFHNFAIAILVFTVLVRLLMLPLTLRQLRAAKAMSAIQPKMQELQRRYANDRQRLSQEQMRLYREEGVNPLGCAVPTLIQFPIWIGLYNAISLVMANTPEQMAQLSQRLYPWLGDLQALIPVEERFLWLNLGQPDLTYIMPVLVAASMWLQQKMMTQPTTDERQKQMNDMMQWMMPLMFGYFTLSFSSGLAIYWVISNIISMVIQYFITGWGGLAGYKLGPFQLPGTPATSMALTTALARNGASARTPALSNPDNGTDDSGEDEGSDRKRPANGQSGSQRKNRRRGNRSGAPTDGGNPVRG
jgi:YidC/Oxa1 family membrane protein insertase